MGTRGVEGQIGITLTNLIKINNMTLKKVATCLAQRASSLTSVRRRMIVPRLLRMNAAAIYSVSKLRQSKDVDLLSCSLLGRCRKP